MTPRMHREVAAVLWAFDGGPATESKAATHLPRGRRNQIGPILLAARERGYLASAGYHIGGLVAYCLTPKGCALLDQIEAAGEPQKEAS